MGKAPKPVYATIEELSTVEAGLNEKIDALKPLLATRAELETNKIKIDFEHNELVQEVEKNKEAGEEACSRVGSDAHEHTDYAVSQSLEESKRLVSELRTDTELKTDELDDRITSMDSKIRDDMATELTNLCETYDRVITDLEQRLTDLIAVRAKQTADNLAGERSSLDGVIEDRRQEAAKDRARVRTEMAEEFAKHRREQAVSHAAQDAANKRAHGELHSRCDAISATVEENRQSATQDSMDSRFMADTALNTYKHSTDKHLDVLDEECRRLNDQILRTQGFATRRVEWTIKNAGTLCRPPGAESGKAFSSWFSPKFHAAGGEDFQLELRVYPELPPTTADGEPTDAIVSGGPAGVGDCAVFLWASKGNSTAVRLFVGDRSAIVEKDYEERVAHGTKRMGFVADHVRVEDDSLVVGGEFLEAIRKVEAILPKRDAKLYGEKPCLPMSGNLLYQYHFNHRTLPIIRKEIERMQARLVRRVEWMVEQASSLPARFGPVEPICSAVFAAAGVEGMQLLFYPSGYSGATEAFCSLFLYCPAGVTMKFRLSIGNQVRDCSNTFDFGGAYGRTNYCRFDILPDPQDDTIKIVFEIEDVTQDVHAKIGSNDTKPKAKGSGNAVADASPVSTTVNLKRVPGKESLVDTKPLPSMWTAKALGDVASPPDGFHTWNELDKSRPKGSASKGKGGATLSLTTSSANLGASRGPTVPFAAQAQPLGSLGGLGKSASAVDFGSPKSQFSPTKPASLLDVRGPSSPMGSTAGMWPKGYTPIRGLGPPSPGRGPKSIPEIGRSASRGNLPALRRPGSTY